MVGEVHKDTFLKLVIQRVIITLKILYALELLADISYLQYFIFNSSSPNSTVFFMSLKAGKLQLDQDPQQNTVCMNQFLVNFELYVLLYVQLYVRAFGFEKQY